jgi:hypothetical protein
MTPDQELHNRQMAAQIADLHAFVFGVHGQGGLAERVKVLEGADIDNRAFKAKVLGVATAAGLAASLLGAKIGAALSALFSNK